MTTWRFDGMPMMYNLQLYTVYMDKCSHIDYYNLQLWLADSQENH